MEGYGNVILASMRCLGIGVYQGFLNGMKKYEMFGLWVYYELLCLAYAT